MSFTGQKLTNKGQLDQSNCPLAVDFEPARDNDSLEKGVEEKEGCKNRVVFGEVYTGKASQKLFRKPNCPQVVQMMPGEYN